MADAVKQITDTSILTVFAADWCGYCKRVLAALKEAGIECNVVDVDQTPGISEALRSKTGKSSVPQVFVGDKWIGGCNDGPEAWMGTIPVRV